MHVLCVLIMNPEWNVLYLMMVIVIDLTTVTLIDDDDEEEEEGNDELSICMKVLQYCV